MILLDADVLLLDLRYQSDSKYAINRQVLDRLKADVVVTGMTSQALLETVGILSFNLSAKLVLRLPSLLQSQYGLTIIPDLNASPIYAGCSIDKLTTQMSLRMSLGDAVQALQIEQNAKPMDLLLTWNAKHFLGKLSVPVLLLQNGWRVKIRREESLLQRPR